MKLQLLQGFCFAVILQRITRLIQLWSHKIVVRDSAAHNLVSMKKKVFGHYQRVEAAPVFFVLLCLNFFSVLICGTVRPLLFYSVCTRNVVNLPGLCSWTRKARGPLAAANTTSPPSALSQCNLKTRRSALTRGTALQSPGLALELWWSSKADTDGVSQESCPNTGLRDTCQAPACVCVCVCVCVWCVCV